MNTILCPNCNTPVEITLALEKQIEEQVSSKQKKKFEEELSRVQKETQEQTSLKAAKQFEHQIKSAKEDAQESAERNKQLIEQITELTKEMRQVKKEKDEVRLEMEKKLSLEEGKIRLDAQKKAEEEQHSKLSEKDKQLQDALKEVEEMRRKLQQGSQQAQGEVFELEFEQLLQQQYPHDKIVPVGKGIKGGDIVQEVWDSRGNYCGKILWELKNTKMWSETWVDKLKTDKRAIKADEAVVISEVTPGNVKNAGFYHDIWVTQRSFVIPLTDSLRVKLIQLVIIKNSLKGKDVKMEALYNYLTGTEFKNRIEAIVDSFTNMQTEIEREKRYFTNKWARDEKNIRQVIDNTYGMHGDLKGILAAAVPHIQGIDLLEDGVTDHEDIASDVSGRRKTLAD